MWTTALRATALSANLPCVWERKTPARAEATYMELVHQIWLKAAPMPRMAVVACAALLALGFILFVHPRAHAHWHDCQLLGQAAGDTGPIRVYDCKGTTYSEPMR
jgi:hypothetical protein